MATFVNAAAKARDGERLTYDEAALLCEQGDLLQLAAWARAAKERRSGRYVYFNVNRHINLTNICVSLCPLCAFACTADDRRAYCMDRDAVLEAVRQTAQKTPGLSEIHIVSALHPDRPFDYYRDIVGAVKQALPHIHLKAFTPVEIVHFAKIAALPVEEILAQLKEAGLDSLPGGGAEILDDAVRRRICPLKATTAEWIGAVKAASRLGLPTNATMLYGHVETAAERLRHLFTLRDIQDETNGFQAFVAFPFHPEHTQLSRLRRVSSWEDLKWIALARLILDNIDHVKAFWIMLTAPIAQMALAFGADDLDGTVEEEKIIHAAGAATDRGIAKEDLIELIRQTGYTPLERDTFYRPAKEALS